VQYSQLSGEVGLYWVVCDPVVWTREFRMADAWQIIDKAKVELK